MSSKMNRRKFVSTSAVGLGVIGAASAGLSSIDGYDESTPSVVGTPSSESPTTKIVQGQQSERLTQLVTPFTTGSVIANSELQSVSVNSRGMGELVLKSSDGQTYQIDVCKRDVQDDSATVIARTKHYGLFLRNGGTGVTPTDESMGQVVLAVASAIRHNETEQAELDLISKNEYWTKQA